MESVQILEVAIVGIGSATAAFAGVKSAVNGMRDDVKQIKQQVSEIGPRVAVLETRMDHAECIGRHRRDVL